MRADSASLAVLLLLGCSAATPPVDRQEPTEIPGLEQVADVQAALEQCEARTAMLPCLRATQDARKLIAAAPDTYAARRMVEILAQRPAAVKRAGQPPERVLADLYERLKHTSLAGHLLFYHAQLQAEAEAQRDALYLLLVLVDHHPDSPLWDDAVWTAADLLHGLGRHGDEAVILEEALAPNACRGVDALQDGFTQRVRLRLAGLYKGQGRSDEALRQLDLVVNFHSTESLKDDALWMAATIHAETGDRERERTTLAFLVKQCPWSRYRKKAEARLAGEWK